MKLKVDIKPDIKKLLTWVNQNNRNLITYSQRALRASAILLHKTIVYEIETGDRRGRLYKRKNGIPHRASAPGEYPKTDRGGLVQNIHWSIGYLTASVGSNLDYAKWLEEGTPKMAARPWLERTRKAKEPEIQKLLDDAIKAALNK